ncbi:dTDP-4-dehydrorhamnose reductase family protein [Bradyrhizobium lablabi]|uniref:dTDP-4-dehydrorhamnose reductase family protein n=1 Tax=Bradyrhizobium lablabi TaxID=722472 RepID=UPI00090C3831|nr:SDR family oxidoreductase [Bradyrhizobium lablabi]SHM80868.1 dTDP-4-dehydrorhamnose reductase [Bradyrhizobium lablabi]
MSGKARKILVLGASGMLGNAVFRFLADNPDYLVYGSVRSTHAVSLFAPEKRSQILVSPDALELDGLTKLFALSRPDVVINCIGVVKQLTDAEDPLITIPINSILPHRLARLSSTFGARLVHVSTDCVFSGKKGMYREDDFADCDDLYGRSKFLGEVDYPNAITLRTSIVGHEMSGDHGLLNWFLAQHGQVKGFTRAIFSGLPTVEIAQVIRDFVLPNPDLKGVYHVSTAPISKFDLLKLIAEVYDKSIVITPDARLVIDRSLDSSLFRTATGYAPPPWSSLVRKMHRFG